MAHRINNPSPWISRKLSQGELLKLRVQGEEMALDQNGRIQLILEYEQNFADHLASKVFKNPEINLWMILIPIIFVFYLNDLKKIKDGRQVFVVNYLLSRHCALKEATEVINNGRKPDLQSLAATVDMPSSARPMYAELLAVLVQHYNTLLNTAGDDYHGLLHNAYASHQAYSNFLSRLNKAEKALNRVLKLELEKSSQEVSGIIHSIENHSADIRRSDADHFFL